MKTISIGMNRGKGRLWLEGQWLAQAGFSRGLQFDAIVSNRTITLTVNPEGKRRVSGKVKAGVTIPIIDMNGAELTPLIGKASVTIEAGRIVVVAVAVAGSVAVQAVA
jgi:hypothetical protein